MREEFAVLLAVFVDMLGQSVTPTVYEDPSWMVWRSCHCGLVRRREAHLEDIVPALKPWEAIVDTVALDVPLMSFG